MPGYVWTKCNREWVLFGPSEFWLDRVMSGANFTWPNPFLTGPKFILNDKHGIKSLKRLFSEYWTRIRYLNMNQVLLHNESDPKLIRVCLYFFRGMTCLQWCLMCTKKKKKFYWSYLNQKVIMIKILHILNNQKEAQQKYLRYIKIK